MRAAVGLVSLWMCGVAAAQTPSPAPMRLSLEEALDVALDRSEQVAIAQAGVRSADADLMRARSEWFPQLNATLSYDRTLATEFEAFKKTFGPPLGTGQGNTPELPFGQSNVYRAGFSLTQNVFAGGRILARVEAVASQKRSARFTTDSTRASVVFDTAQAYFDVVLADQLLAIAESTLQQAERTLEQVRLAREEGTRPEFDLLRARVARDNQRPVVIQRGTELRLALLRLRQLLDLAPDQPLELTTHLDAEAPVDAAGLGVAAARLPAGVSEERRIPLIQAEETVEQNVSRLRIAQSQRLPTINVNSQLGFVAYPQGLPTIGDVRTNWTVGVALQVPLFTGLRVTGDEHAAQALLEQAEAQALLTQELATLDTSTAHERLESSQAAWDASSGTVQEARRAYEIAQLRFQEGVSTQLELNDAQIQLDQALATRARAARDLQLARMRVALLPALPLGTTAGSATAVVTGAGSGGVGQGSGVVAPSIGATGDVTNPLGTAPPVVRPGGSAAATGFTPGQPIINPVAP